MPIFLSEESERMKKQAEQLSSKLGHYYLGCEHIFLTVMDSRNWLGEELQSEGLEMESVREAILNICGPGDEQPVWRGIIMTPRLKRVMKLAEREAESRRAYRVEANHIISAILREGRSVPCRVLESQNADLKNLRQCILNLELGSAPSTPGELKAPAQGMAPYNSAGSAYSHFIAQRGKALTPADPSGRAGEEARKHKEKPREKQVKTPTLDRLGRDMVQMAREGKIDPIVGRKDEIRRMIQTLTKKSKNNPIIVGEAGVGKTAVVYGLAQRIAEGRVPAVIKNKTLIELNMASMVAGTKHRGEFEERMQKLIKELLGNPDIIVFIDEIHTIIGAGDSRGGMDAGNILKPHLARGEITVIGATTVDEYRRYIEKDPALERRFQPVMVDEPSEEETVEILDGLKERYEKHHGVTFTQKGILAAVKLSVRYIPDRNLPDKAIDLMDEAAARCKMSSMSISSEEELKQLSNEITEVTDEQIAEVISLWTGIPASKLTQEESERLLHMEDYLRKRVVGQESAVKTVAQTIRMVRMGLSSPNRPSGVFLFLGPTGVGKTELAKSLAEFLFGSEKDLIRLDMSEYMEQHAISRMIGSPPGYVGHEEEGQLTSAVRTKPYSVVLLDEIEKAHPKVFDLFLQVFDDGRLTDAKGRTVNFTNTILILTSNIGTDKIDFSKENFDVTNDQALRETILEELKGHFRPEFLNRIDEIIVFNPLSQDVLLEIVRMNLITLADQLYKQREISLRADESAMEYLLQQGYDPAYGARPMKRAIQNYLSKPLAETMLAKGIHPGDSVVATFNGEKLFFQRVDPDGYAPGETLAGRGPDPGPRPPDYDDNDDYGTGKRLPMDQGTLGPEDFGRTADPRHTKGQSRRRAPLPPEMEGPPSAKRPILGQRGPHQDIQGMLPMKGPMTGPPRPPGNLGPDDMDSTQADI
ncbi:MAG: ATP-dependent Clp protease ATP-binding subunit [Vulcanimicrobiota bacterium]